MMNPQRIVLILVTVLALALPCAAQHDQRTALLWMRAGEKTPAGTTEVKLPFLVKNLETAPGRGLRTEIALEVTREM